MKKYPIQDCFDDLNPNKIHSTIENIRKLAAFNYPTYIIAMTARTGSTAISSLLSETKFLGDPAEYFNPRGHIQHTTKKTIGNEKISFVDYLSYIGNHHRNKWFALKTNWIDFEFFVANNLQNILFKNAAYIYLDRLDIEAQAVSLFHAIITDKWHITQNDNFDSFDEKLLIEKFDLPRISALISSLENEKKQWHNYFFSEDKDYLPIHYEFFLNNSQKCTKKIVEYLGEDVSKIQMEYLSSNYVKKIKPAYQEWLKKLRHYRSAGFYTNLKNKGII